MHGFQPRFSPLEPHSRPARSLPKLTSPRPPLPLPRPSAEHPLLSAPDPLKQQQLQSLMAGRPGARTRGAGGTVSYSGTELMEHDKGRAGIQVGAQLAPVLAGPVSCRPAVLCGAGERS